MDINRDGVITFDEFMETCRRVSKEGLYFKVNKQAWRHPAETWRNQWQFLYKNVKTGQQFKLFRFLLLEGTHSIPFSFEISFLRQKQKKVIGIPLTYLEFLGVVLDIQVEQLGGVITDYSIEFNHELMVKMPKEIWSWLDLYWLRIYNC